MLARQSAGLAHRPAWGQRLSDGVAESRVMARLTVRMTWELYVGAVQLLLEHVERRGA
jgi:hypothetical protein